MELTDFEKIFKRFWNAIGRANDYNFKEFLNEHYQFVKEYDNKVVETAYTSYASYAQDNLVPPVGRILSIIKELSASNSHDELFHTTLSRFALVCCEDLCQNPRHKRYRSHFKAGVESKDLYRLLCRNVGNRQLTDEELDELNKIRAKNGSAIPMRPYFF